MGLFLLAVQTAQSQTEPTPVTPTISEATPIPSPEMGPEATLSPVPTMPATVYQFNSDTVWAHLNAAVKPGDHRFSVEVQSSSPLSGWILKDPTGNQILAKGGCKPTTSVRFQVKSTF